MTPPFRLHHDSFGRLVLSIDGIDHASVEAIRAFPLTAPQQMVSLCSAEGRELLWIEDLASLPADLRDLLQAELARRDFVPVVKRIVRISAAVEPSEWDVETDRGPTRFLVNSEEDIHSLTGGRALITDASGIRYLIANVDSLDSSSRRLLERFL